MEQMIWDIFKDSTMNAEFAKKGYAILTIDDLTTIDELSKLYSEAAASYQASFTATLLVQNFSHRKEIHEKVSAVLATTIDKYFKSYRQICCGFAVKKANDDSSHMPLHQDISMVEPEGRPGLSFWFPLVSTNEKNGNLQLVPKSHLFYRHERAAGTPFPLLDKEKELRAYYLEAIPTKKGQIIVFDQTLFHASPPNLSSENRVVATSVLLPEEKPTYYYHRKFNTTPVELTSYQVTDDFYFTHQLGMEPEHIEAVAHFLEYSPPKDLSLFPKLIC